MSDQTIQMATWESTFRQWEEFECNGSCNSGSPFCTHMFVWNCPKCGAVQSEIGEDMDVRSFHNGVCESCEYASEYAAAQDESAEQKGGFPF